LNQHEGLALARKKKAKLNSKMVEASKKKRGLCIHVKKGVPFSGEGNAVKPKRKP